MLACETFHADVHAGNLWLLRDGRIGFLDFGTYVVISCVVLVLIRGSLKYQNTDLGSLCSSLDSYHIQIWDPCVLHLGSPIVFRSNHLMAFD